MSLRASSVILLLVSLGLALALAGAYAPIATGQSLRYIFPWKVLVFGIEPGQPYIINDIHFDPNPIQGYAPISGEAVIITPAGVELIPFSCNWSGYGLVNLYLMKNLDSDDNERAFPLLYPSLSDLYPNLYPDYEKRRLKDEEEANALLPTPRMPPPPPDIMTALKMGMDVASYSRMLAAYPDKLLFAGGVFYFENGMYVDARRVFLTVCDSVDADAETKEAAKAYLKLISERR